MARARTARYPKAAVIEPEDISQDLPEEEPAFPAEGFGKASKTEAVRIALSDGLDSIDDIQAFVRAKFGHDMPKNLISSYKSRLGSREVAKPVAVTAPRPKPQPAVKTMNKTEAVRAAIEAGYDMPTAAVKYIDEAYGIEMLPTHFSAIKSQMKKKDAAKPKGRPGRKPREAAPLVEGFVAPPPRQKADGDVDLLETLKTLKPLVASLGADKLKTLVDLLG